MSHSDIINESSKSIKEDFLRINQEFVDKGIDTSFKTLNSNIYSVVNSAFANFNNDYERKLDHNRETHEKAIVALGLDLKKLKESYKNKKINAEKQERSLEYLLDRIQRLKVYSKVFRSLKDYKIKRDYKKLKRSMIVDKFLKMKRKRKIITSWRNIANVLSKGRIRIKYGKIYNEQYNEMQFNYISEIKKMEEILQNLELDIKKEIDERRSLTKLYDLSMNKGVEVFVKETNAIVDFNSSGVSTPMERSFRDEKNK